jgi:hypothetical protein
MARDLKVELRFIEVALRPDNSSSVVSESINSVPSADIVVGTAMAHNDAAIAVHAAQTAVKKLVDAIVSIGRRRFRICGTSMIARKK